MQGFWEFDESFDSCITATLNLFLSSTTLSSVSVLPISLALSCRTLNVLSSLMCSADGAGDGSGDCWVFEAEQRSQVQSLLLQYCATFNFKVQKILHAAIQNICCTGNLLVTFLLYTGNGVLGSRAWIWMYVTHHLKEQELGLIVVVTALWSY